jgi:hypothetical protein
LPDEHERSRSHHARRAAPVLDHQQRSCTADAGGLEARHRGVRMPSWPDGERSGEAPDLFTCAGRCWGARKTLRIDAAFDGERGERTLAENGVELGLIGMIR